VLKTADFDYNLPQELIAQKPTFPRDQCRLLVLDRKSGQIEHRHFFEVIDYLKKGDVLVLNNSKVFKARLFGRIKFLSCPPFKKGDEGGFVEIFLLREVRNNIWEVLGNPGRKLKAGIRVYFSKTVWCEVIGKNDDKYQVRFNISGDKFQKFLSRYGHVPVPPYIKQEPKQFEEYQTVYAKHLGSIAAPTAGFHFTKPLLQRLKKKGVKIVFVTLHVGYGTFKPIKTERVEEHKMEAEWVEITETTAEAINRAKKEGGRVIAVGTTTVRALEGSCLLLQPPLKIRGGEGGVMKFQGEVNIFITPEFKFKVINALVTNFHLPKSTLLLLVSALASRDVIMKAYREAIKKHYHFYSFGDAMLIL